MADGLATFPLTIIGSPEVPKDWTRSYLGAKAMVVGIQEVKVSSLSARPPNVLVYCRAHAMS